MEFGGNTGSDSSALTEEEKRLQLCNDLILSKMQ